MSEIEDDKTVENLEDEDQYLFNNENHGMTQRDVQ